MNKDDLKLRKDLEEIRTSYNRAKRLLKNIEVFSVDDFTTQFIEWRETLEDADTGLDATINKITNSKEKISGISKESLSILEELKENLTSVDSDIKKMQESYENFLEIKGKIEVVDGSISNISDNAKQLKNDIEKIKTQSQDKLENINDLFKKAESQILNMQEAYQKFLDIKSKVEDENSGLHAIFSKANISYKKLLEISKDIQSYRDESSKYLAKIKEDEKESKKITGGIKTLLETTKETTNDEVEKIKKITSLITDTGFANAFHKQANKLMNVRIFWGIVTIASTVGLFIYVLMYIVPLGKFGLEIGDLLYRITITSPLVFLIGFSAGQYGSETKKSDKYAFKAVTASSISHHTEFLKKEFPKNNEEVLSFATDTFTKIYREPYEDNPDLKKDLLKLENSINKEILLKKGGDTSLEKIVATAKELRNMFPNDDTLQGLIEYLKNPKNK